MPYTLVTSPYGRPWRLLRRLSEMKNDRVQWRQLPMTSLLAAAAVAHLCGCATTPEGLTQAEIQSVFEDAARTRAAFELSCPADELTLTSLGDPTSAGLWTTDRVYGATGCDRRAVYVARCTFSSPDGVVITSRRCSAFLNSDEVRESPPATTSSTTTPSSRPATSP